MFLYDKWVIILLIDPGLKPSSSVATAQTSEFHFILIFGSQCQFCTFQGFGISFIDTSAYHLKLYTVNLRNLLVHWGALLVSHFRGHSQNGNYALLFLGTSMIIPVSHGRVTGPACWSTNLSEYTACHPLEQKEDVYDECVSIKLMGDQIVGDSDCSSWPSGGARDKEVDNGSVSEPSSQCCLCSVCRWICFLAFLYSTPPCCNFRDLPYEAQD